VRSAPSRRRESVSGCRQPPYSALGPGVPSERVVDRRAGERRRRHGRALVARIALVRRSATSRLGAYTPARALHRQPEIRWRMPSAGSYCPQGVAAVPVSALCSLPLCAKSGSVDGRIRAGRECSVCVNPEARLSSPRLLHRPGLSTERASGEAQFWRRAGRSEYRSGRALPPRVRGHWTLLL
jgi:hypothetical protein